MSQLSPILFFQISYQNHLSCHLKVFSASSTSYEFLVVGGGAGGLVVANRLAEDISITVLVLEAGANHIGNSKIHTPSLITLMYDDPDYDWSFSTVPQVGEARWGVVLA